MTTKDDEPVSKRKTTDTTPKAKNNLDSALAVATAKKKEFANVMVAGQSLQRQMAAGEWQWARGEAMKLDDLIRQFETSETSLTSAASSFIASEIKDIKKEYRDRPHQLQSELEDFLKAIEKPLKRVSVRTRRILAIQVEKRGVA